MGKTLWPGDKWRCMACLSDHLPGRDSVSKSMHKTIEYADEIREAFDLESEDLRADGLWNRAEWARIMAAEIRKQGTGRATNITQALGEVLPPVEEKFLHDTLAIPDLAAVEASLDRGRLLLQSGTDVAAMALDAANSLQASNSLERMLAHQMAATHKVAMEQMAQAPYESTVAAQAKRLNVAARCMTIFQQGLLTFQKVRRGGQQHIRVQYVSVSDGGQAVIGNVERGAHEERKCG